MTVEDCMCCDLEVIDARTSIAERKFLFNNPNEANCPFVPLKEDCCKGLVLDNVWDDPVSEMSVSVCNFTYSPAHTEISFCLSSSCSDAPTVGQIVQPHGTSDYITCASMPTQPLACAFVFIMDTKNRIILIIHSRWLTVDRLCDIKLKHLHCLPRCYFIRMFYETILPFHRTGKPVSGVVVNFGCCTST